MSSYKDLEIYQLAYKNKILGKKINKFIQYAENNWK